MINKIFGVNPDEKIPLCVDLDGTLLRSDSLMETFCLLLKQKPFAALRAPFWLAGGRANLKRQIVERVQLNVSAWPLHPGLLDFLRAEKNRGRKLVLATAADQHIATAIQSRLNLFDEIIASDGQTNLAGKTKTDALIQKFGEKRFDYAGNSFTDLPVWAAANAAIVVSADKNLAARAAAVTKVAQVFTAPAPSLKDRAKALRVHQWSKNLLLLIPLMGAHKWMEPAKLIPVLIGIAVFSIGASSVYLLNDLLDLEADRHHHSKKFRPFASGKIPLLSGLLLAPLLLAVAVALSFLLGKTFAAVFGIYYLLTLLYSLRLKQVELLDVLVLAGLYGIRVLAGGVAADVPVSDWLLMFSLFAFLSLAFAKRFTELRLLRGQSDAKVKGRAYISGDTELVSSMGVGSGYLSVLVLAMYITHPSVTALYHQPQVLWLACPVLFYWISRVWLLAHRGHLNDDPILFALRDKQSWLVAALIGIIGFCAGPK